MYNCWINMYGKIIKITDAKIISCLYWLVYHYLLGNQLLYLSKVANVTGNYCNHTTYFTLLQRHVYRM